VEQFGSPMELYHHPATRFVATFIGQPNMNLLPASVLGSEAAGLAVEFAGGHRAVLPVDAGRARPGDRVDVGIRPENLSLGADLPMQVNILERLGGVSITYGVTPDGHRLCAALPGDAAVREGAAVQLGFNPADAHVFDASGAVMRRLKAPALAA
jgi:multiple sugar transport system ATP-binding protein